jgi:ABC-type bacteriocin/lantibiotic exporter with double-glycine peptidase domain
MVATHLRVPVSALELLRQLPVYRDGVSLYDVALWLESHGLRAAASTSDVAELRRLVDAGLPVIVALDEGGKHTVVAVDYDRRALAIFDPGAPGRRAVAWVELERSWAATQHQVLLVWSPSVAPPLPAPALARHLAADRQFRADELRLRARPR